MQIAFISDIHGNIHALRAAWKFIQERGVEQTFCLGDLVGYGANPSEVIDFVESHTLRCTLGSSDARVAYELNEKFEKREGLSEQTLEWTKTILTPEHKQFLRKLPTSGRLETPKGRLRYCHGSPYDPDDRLDLHGPAQELNELLASLHCEVLVCGGTHIPYIRSLMRGVVVDPGSVGLSLNGEPGADVTILTISETDVKTELIKVPYNLEAAAADIITWKLPKLIAGVIRSGRMA